MDKFFSSRNTIILSIVVFLIFFVYRIALIFYPTPDVGGVEGNIIYFIQRILDGQALYTDPAQPPYAIAQYPPLYYHIVSAAARIAGVGPDDVYSIFITGRIISLLLNIGLIVIVFFIARKIYFISFSRSLLVSVASFIFLDITSFARPDSLYHFFFMLTLYILLKSFRDKEEGRDIGKTAIIYLAIFSIITFFSKQTGIILFVINFSWLAFLKEYRKLFMYLGFCLGTLTIFLIGIQSLFGMHSFLKNTIIGINNGISFGWYRGVFINSFYLGIGLLFLSLFIAVLFIIRKESRLLLRLSGFTLLLLFVFLNGIGLKLGSSPGYLTEWWTLLFVLVAFYWSVLVKKISGIGKGLPAIVVCATMTIKLLLISATLIKTIKISFSPDKMDAYRGEKDVAGLVKSKMLPGEKYVVFTNLYTPESFISNFLFRHAVVPQFEIVALSTYPQKKYDYSRLEQELQNGDIKWMLMEKPNSTKVFFAINLDKYVLTDSVGPFSLYRFKP